MAERINPVGIETVIVGNNKEYFSPIDPYVPEPLRDEFVQADIDEADMDIMWCGDDKIVLLPEKIDPDFVSDISGLFKYRNAHVYIPHDRGFGLSGNLIHDQETLDAVTRSIQSGNNPQFIPFGHTPQYQRLTDTLRSKGLVFSMPETPNRSALWVPEYGDTKVGSREVLIRAREKNPNIKIPEGFVCSSVEEAMKLVNYFLETGRGVVFKANIGGSGIGVNVFPPSEFGRTSEDNQAKIASKVRKNPLLSVGPVIVEEYVQPDFSRHGVFPSVDAVIRDDGSVNVQAVDAMVIHHDDEVVGFYGCVLGRGLFTPQQNARLKKMGLAVGKELAALGYKGWYDVDFILSTSGDFYATECNLRRTSICYMLDLAELLFGEDFENKMAMRSNDKYIRANLDGISYSDLKQILKTVLYPINDQQRGIVITQSLRSMYQRGKFGYVSIGKDQDDTRDIELELDRLLTRG